MHAIKKASLIVFSIYPSINFLDATSNTREDLYEEKIFNSSELKGLKFQVDKGEIDINFTDQTKSRILFKKVSGEGDVKFSILKGGELTVKSTNSPNGGCDVNYKAYVPKGTSITILAGSALVSLENMGEVDVTAGSLELKAQNIGPINLTYSSGKAEVKYDQLPPYTYSSVINSSNGSTTFCLPSESTVKFNASKEGLVKSEFESSLRAKFAFIFNSSNGRLNIKKN